MTDAKANIDHGPNKHPDRLMGIAEIAELAGSSRQAITNLRARDYNFPAPLAELRSGPVFREQDVRTYLHSRGRAARHIASEDVQRRRTGRFDPLSRVSLAQSVERALIEEPLNSLPLVDPFNGAGVYCIYYSGPYELYAPIADYPPQVPVYVGDATPRRNRVRDLLTPIDQPLLFNRLREHANTLEQVEQLTLADFYCRFLVVDEMWAPLALDLLIHHLRPVWNVVVEGFGSHAPGGGRYRTARSDWDELHPGRPWALKQEPSRHKRSEILEAVEAHLRAVQSPDLGSVPHASDVNMLDGNQ
jgi:hypothetical protein